VLLLKSCNNMRCDIGQHNSHYCHAVAATSPQWFLAAILVIMLLLQLQAGCRCYCESRADPVKAGLPRTSTANGLALVSSAGSCASASALLCSRRYSLVQGLSPTTYRQAQG